MFIHCCKFKAIALTAMRIVFALLFFYHGGQKLFGWFGGIGGATVDLASLMGAAGILEFVGGILLMLGLFTQPTAFILSGQMAVTYFMMHAPKGMWPPLNGGELALLYCFGFLYLAAAGGGKWSLDALFFGGCCGKEEMKK